MSSTGSPPAGQHGGPTSHGQSCGPSSVSASIVVRRGQSRYRAAQPPCLSASGDHCRGRPYPHVVGGHRGRAGTHGADDRAHCPPCPSDGAKAGKLARNRTGRPRSGVYPPIADHPERASKEPQPAPGAAQPAGRPAFSRGPWAGRRQPLAFPGAIPGPIAPTQCQQGDGAHARPTGIPDVTIHDLRRTVGTYMSQLGVPRDVRERILNHGGSAPATSPIASTIDTNTMPRSGPLSNSGQMRWTRSLGGARPTSRAIPPALPALRAGALSDVG